MPNSVINKHIMCFEIFFCELLVLYNKHMPTYFARHFFIELTNYVPNSMFAEWKWSVCSYNRKWKINQKYISSCMSTNPSPMWEQTCVHVIYPKMTCDYDQPSIFVLTVLEPHDWTHRRTTWPTLLELLQHLIESDTFKVPQALSL